MCVYLVSPKRYVYIGEEESMIHVGNIKNGDTGEGIY